MRWGKEDSWTESVGAVAIGFVGWIMLYILLAAW